MEAELVRRAGVKFEAIPAAGLHGVGWRRMPGNAATLARGMLASRRILSRYRPDAMFLTGGYLAAPMAVAGRHVPTLVFVPDTEPGLALRFLGRFADRIVVTVDETRMYFDRPERVRVSGYPLRADLRSWTRLQALAHLGLSPKLPTLLVSGGSLGAHSINKGILEQLPLLLDVAQVIHLTGPKDMEHAQFARRRLPTGSSGRYHPLPYLHEMGAALAAADLVVSRAGASTLGEYPAFGLPAVLVPYPHAWSYQKQNAGYLVERGCAVLVMDSEIGARLVDLVRELFADRGRMHNMRQAMLALARPNAADEIARQLVELAGDERH